MIKITTTNSTYINGECVENNNEVHEILGLQGFEHILATIESVAKNNLKYKKQNSELDYITVSMSFTERDTLKRVIGHYSDNPTICNIKPGLYLIN